MKRRLRFAAKALLRRTPIGGLVRSWSRWSTPLDYLTPIKPAQWITNSGLEAAFGDYDFAVICPILNEQDSLPRLIESIERQTIRPGRVIFVDGGSTDESVPLLKSLPHPWIDIISADGSNAAQARNIGTAQSREKYLLFIDAGCFFNQDLFASLVSLADAHNLNLVASKYELVGTDESYSLSRFVPEWDATALNSFLPSGRGLLLTRQFYDAIGGFPEHLSRTGEDTLFSVNARRVLTRIGFNEVSPISWVGPKTSQLAERRAKEYRAGDLESRLSDWLDSNRFPSRHETVSRCVLGMRATVDARRNMTTYVAIVGRYPLGHQRSARAVALVQDTLKSPNTVVIYLSFRLPGWSVRRRRVVDLDLSRLEAHSLKCWDDCGRHLVDVYRVASTIFEDAKLKADFEEATTRSSWWNLGMIEPSTHELVKEPRKP